MTLPKQHVKLKFFLNVHVIRQSSSASSAISTAAVPADTTNGKCASSVYSKSSTQEVDRLFASSFGTFVVVNFHV
jgi:hypothetical protein